MCVPTSPASSRHPWKDHYNFCNLQRHPGRYIRLVQHLIEKCLTFHMDRDDCVRKLAKHANIQPIVTITVWDGLMKENPEFFSSYFHELSRSKPSFCASSRSYNRDVIARQRPESAKLRWMKRQ